MGLWPPADIAPLNLHLYDHHVIVQLEGDAYTPNVSKIDFEKIYNKVYKAGHNMIGNYYGTGWKEWSMHNGPLGVFQFKHREDATAFVLANGGEYRLKPSGIDPEEMKKSAAEFAKRHGVKNKGDLL